MNAVDAPRRALVTGASRGIGQAVATALTADDWLILEPPRQDLDLGSTEAISEYLDRLPDPIDGIVLNAGVNDPAPIDTMTRDTWLAIQQVNLTSSVQLVQHLVPIMARRGFGRVVMISSLYADRARPGRAAYAASKAGLESLARSITVEFAMHGVMANAVAPGFVDTELTRRNNPPETLAALLDRVPVGRLGAAEEVAEVVRFLMSPRNTYVTGQTIVVDGGYSCT